jgi:plastocyanin
VGTPRVAPGAGVLLESKPMLARFTVLAALWGACLPAQAAGVSVAVTNAAGAPLADAVVMLEPVGARLPVKPMANVQIAQHDLQFSPAVSVVTVGTPVMFPNQDTVRHHVYSYSAAKTFQIKLYAGVPHTPIVFDKPGVAVLGCNIHDGMIAWVVVTDTPLWARRVADVPAGSYQLHVWHASLAEALAPQRVAVTVGAGDVDQALKLGPNGLAR